MDLLVTVSKKDSIKLLKPLIAACLRSECQFAVFLTHQGVLVLTDEDVSTLLNDASENVVACHESWVKHTHGRECPVTLGSQTNHSELMARARRMVSL